MSTRNRIVLIGNGFDLAHGLKTSYGDFVIWLLLSHIEKASTIRFSECDLFSVNVSKHLMFKYDFETLKEKINSIEDLKSINWVSGINDKENKPINFKIKSAFFHEIIKYNNWTDIEGTYYLRLKKIYDNSKNRELDINILNSDFNSIKKFFAEYIKLQEEIDNEIFMNQDFDEKHTENKNDSNNYYSNKNLTNLITICEEKTNLFAPFEHVVFTSHSNFYELSLDDVYFLNFNYTGVLSRYTSFHGESINNYFEDNVFNIHGSVNEEDTIVFGYGDEKDDYFEKMESTNIDGFLEHFKSNYYGQNGQYFNLLKVLKSPFDVIVIGHSLGLSDRLLLNTIFEHENCNYIHLQYRGDAVGHFRKRLAISRHFNDKKKLRDRLFPMIEELKL